MKCVDEFWGYYLTQHTKPWTRRWHFVATALTMALFISSFLFNWKYALWIPVTGYGIAWYSHFFVEGNVPATFGHPVLSFLCDCKMFGLMLTGKMDTELKRIEKKSDAACL